MAIITTDTYLDGGTARTAGETWDLSGCTLTIRTDTRWHANAPASMTGSFGNIVFRYSGTFKVDGTKVRWMAFDTGTGTTPAIGTTISQGGVSGYLLGVWANYTSAPTTVGAAMPTTGYLKFREVTGGQFSTGALTGIGANALSPDVTGWIEVVRDQSTSLDSIITSNSAVFLGEWFYLQDTTGDPLTVYQIPTNGGGAGTYCLGVQIETAVGSDVYEWWPAAHSAIYTAANISTDNRCMFIYSPGSGQFRIGSDNSNTLIGRYPTIGRKIRIPNIFLRQCTTAARAVNAINATLTNRPTFKNIFSMPVAFNVVADKVMCDWYVNLYSSKSSNLSNSVFDSQVYFYNAVSASVIDIICIANVSLTSTIGLSIEYCTNLTISNSTFSKSNNTPNIQLTGCSEIFSSYNKFIAVQPFFAQDAIRLVSTSNCIFDNTTLIGGGIRTFNSNNIKFTNTDFSSISKGTTSSSVSGSLLLTIQSGGITIDGVKFGLNGTISGVHPYSYIVNATDNTGKITVRNLGTRLNILSTAGAGASNYTDYIYYGSGTASNIDIKRVYLSNIKSQLYQVFAAHYNSVFENIYISAYAQLDYFLNSELRGCRANTVTWGASIPVYGINYIDYFTSDTAGILAFKISLTNEKTAPYLSYYVNPANKLSGLTSVGINLYSVGDWAIIESHYFAIGHTGFANTAILTELYSERSKFLIEYQIDKGNGWNGTWKDATGANLSAETGINPAIGIKVKVRVTTLTANNTTSVGKLSFTTTSTLAAQAANLYPLDTNTLGFTNLIAGSEVRVYQGTDPATATEIGAIESSGTTFSFSHSSGGQAGVIAIFAMGYQPIYLPYTFKSTDDSILIQQTVDRNYVNP
jgi:hypothetical protein